MPDLTVVRPKALPAIQKLVEEYLLWCRARGLSPKTLHAGYGYPLHHVFLAFCERHGITKPEQLSARTLDRLTSELLEQGGKHGPLSKHSVHSYARTINHFLAWAHQEGEMPRRRSCPSGWLMCSPERKIDKLEAAALNERLVSPLSL